MSAIETVARMDERQSVRPLAAVANGRRHASSPGLHPAVWAAWLAAATAMVFLTSNPFYIAVIGLTAAVVYATYRTPERRALDALLVLAIGTATLAIPLNLLTGSSGSTTIVDLPSVTFPSWLAGVTLGGTVTGESLVYAVTRAASIATIVVLVCAFNAAVDHFRMLKLAPPSLSQLGIILSVSALLVPETLARAASLREARVVRGRGGGLRALPSLLLPLLTEALDRSVQRAESLDARGFGRVAVRSDLRGSVIAVAGVALATIGAFSFYYGSPRLIALLLLGFGTALALLVLAYSGRGSGVVSMRRQPVLARDLGVIALSGAALGLFVAARVAGAGGVEYLPFPELVAPEFDPILAGAALMLLAPAAASLIGGQSP